MITRRNFFELSAAAVGSALSPSLLAEAAATANETVRPPEAAATDVAMAATRRLLGDRAEKIHFSTIAEENGHPVYEVSAEGGQVTVKGSTAAAAMRGLYVYLREACNAMVTWSGEHLDLPATFPSFPVRRDASPYRFVQYYNPVTFGYTTAFWGWKRWEREIDWMALHGVNMPLAMVGQEAVWQTVWRSLGVTQAELDHFSTSPAHLPWHRMGNINNFEGPLPKGWMEGKCALQKKLMARMREFGMKPVVPGFSGFVPQGYKRLHPEAKTYTLFWFSTSKSTIPWNTRTFILGAEEAEAYKEIGRRFIQEYKRQYGPAKYYLVDSFNELNPPVSKANRYEDLARFGKVAYDGILAGDPNGIWVMQGWLFYNQPEFWDSASVKAYLRDVPDDRMIVLDYSNDQDGLMGEGGIAAEQWKLHNAFFGKQWINGMAQTFGGNNNLKGNLRFYATQSAAVLTSPDKGNLVGWSMDPEGTETNEVAYELMTDIGWSSSKIHLDDWIPKYCMARYGGNPAAMQEAWHLLLRSAYKDGRVHSIHAWQTRPSLNPKPEGVDSGPAFQLAAEKFLSCAGELGHRELYRNDLIEIVAQAVGGRVDRHLADACEAHRRGYTELRDRDARESLDMLVRIDGLMHLRADRRLETWVRDARSWAHSPDEAAYYDESARLLITFWGWRELEDYASRVWSGLTRDYYAARWRVFFEELRSLPGTAPDPENVNIWEATWLASPYRPSPPRAVPDLAAEARSMLLDSKKWAGLEVGS